ncbi:MAG: hypothetical protein ACFCVC_17505 [Acidimicrobiia bacterium]
MEGPDAIDMLRRYRSLDGHEFWADDTSFVDATGIDTHQIATSPERVFVVPV